MVYTAIESLSLVLTARVLILYPAVPTRAGVFTTVRRELCNYWSMNKIVLWEGLIAPWKNKINIVPPLEMEKRCSSSYRCWSLVQTDLGRLECTPVRARVGLCQQTQAICVYDERMSAGYIRGVYVCSMVRIFALFLYNYNLYIV